MHMIRGAAFLVSILAVALSFTQFATPAPRPADVPASEFSAVRAMRDLEVVAAVPHPVGSPEQAAVRDYIVERLGDAGLEAEIHEAVGASKYSSKTGTVQNILVRIEGAQPTGAVLLVAHYDSVARAPGAIDDGTGVVTLLETLRAIAAGHRLRHDVIGLFTDGEEMGLWGATAFVEGHPWMADVRVAINLEAVDTTPSTLVRTSDQNGWLIREFARAAPDPVGNSTLGEVFRRLPYGTDLEPFRDRGVPSLDLFTFYVFPEYHTPADTPANADAESIQHHGDQALALARHFGQTSFEDTNDPDAVYFNLIGDLFVHYPQSWSVPLAVLATLLFAGVLFLGRDRVTLRGTVAGTVVAAGAIVLGVLLATTSWSIASTAVPPPAADGPSPHWPYDGLVMVGLGALAVGCVWAVFWMASWRIARPDLLAGAVVSWLLLACVSAVEVPGASYVFVWPLLLVLASVGVALIVSPERGGSWGGVLVWAFVASPAVLLVVPLVYMFFLGTGMDFLWLHLLLVALAAELLVPAWLVLFSADRPGVNTRAGLERNPVPTPEA